MGYDRGLSMRLPSLATCTRPRPIAAWLALAIPLAGCAPETLAPAADESPRYMAAAATRDAAEVGRDVLARGGSAVDAAIAMAMVLNLTEPQSAGLGGGGFLLHYDAASGAVTAYDGRETAPAGAAPDMFLDADGDPKDYETVMVGGGAVGVPGLLAMLETAHRDHGKLAWRELFAPAIRLAEEGFAVTERLSGLIAGDEYLKHFSETAAYFFDAGGDPPAPGETLRNPAFADTLREIAANGSRAFYDGPIARDIAAAVRTTRNPGTLAATDMAHYRARRLAAVCGPYRGYKVCGMPPPSSGGLAVLQILGILEHFDLAAMEPASLDSVHVIAEASRLAFADRNAYAGDPDFVLVPAAAMLAPDYLARRARLISPERAMGEVRPGVFLSGQAPADRVGGVSTTHLSVIDKDGNAAAMTASIQTAFGSRIMVRGFLLNNELTDFSFRPAESGRMLANAPAAGKKPLSSMSPTLVFDDRGRLVLAVGSPGGSSIIGYVLKTLVGVLDWKLGIQAAIDLPHFVDKTEPLLLEAETPITALEAPLEAMGHAVEVRPMTSGLYAIEVTPEGLAGGADERRPGAALGN